MVAPRGGTGANARAGGGGAGSGGGDGHGGGERDWRGDRLAGLIITAGCTLFFALHLGGSLYNGDESIYGELARNLLSGSLLDLRWQDTLVVQRPPLYPWLLAAAAGIFGLGEVGLRLASVACGALACGLTYWLGRRVARLPPGLAAFASLHLAFATLFYRYSRVLASDIALAALFCATFAAFSLGRRQPRWLVVAGALLGLCLMTKQAVGALPLCAFAAHALDRFGSGRTRGDRGQSDRGDRGGSPPRLSRRHLGWALLAVLLTWLPWHIYSLLAHGRTFAEGYFGYNILRRASQAVLEDTQPWFYPVAYYRAEGPLALLAAAGLVLGLLQAVRGLLARRGAARQPAATARDGGFAAWLLVLWPLLLVLPLSAAASRLDYYLVPAYPALSLLVATLIARLPSTRLRGVLCGLLLAASLTQHVAPRFRPQNFSPAMKLLASRAALASQPNQPLYVFDEGYFAARFYGQRPTTGVIMSRQAHGELMRRGAAGTTGALPGEILRLGRKDLHTHFAARSTYWIIVRRALASRLAGLPLRTVASTPGHLLLVGRGEAAAPPLR